MTIRIPFSMRDQEKLVIHCEEVLDEFYLRAPDTAPDEGVFRPWLR